MQQDTLNDQFVDLIGKYTAFGGRILDIGTGTGYVIDRVKEAFPDRFYSFLGIDRTSDKETLKKWKDNNEVLYMRADNHAIPLKDGTIETVVAKHVIDFSPDEIARVLKNKGKFLFRGFGESRGFVEIAELFPGRMNRARSVKDYEQQLANAGLNAVQAIQGSGSGEYNVDSLFQLLKENDMIRDLSGSDKYRITEAFDGARRIRVKSDPLILIAEKSR